MASGDVGDLSDRMDWETNPRPETRVLTSQIGNFAALTESLSLLLRFEMHSKIQAIFEISQSCNFLFFFMYLLVFQVPVRWATLLPVVNGSTKYPSLLPAVVACLKDARSGNEEGPSGPVPTPPTYIVNPLHFYYHQDNYPDMIPIKIYDMENPMLLVMRVKLLV